MSSVPISARTVPIYLLLYNVHTALDVPQPSNHYSCVVQTPAFRLEEQITGNIRVAEHARRQPIHTAGSFTAKRALTTERYFK